MNMYIRKLKGFFTKYWNNSLFSSKQVNNISYVSYAGRNFATIFDLLLIIIVLSFIGNLLNLNPPSEILEILKTSQTNLREIDDYSKNLLISYSNKMLFWNGSIFLILIFSVWYFVYKFGGTPGKLLLGFRIADKFTLQNPSKKQSVVRLFSVVISILPFFLGILWLIFDKKNQTWHDKLANTVVIKKYK